MDLLGLHFVFAFLTVSCVMLWGKWSAKSRRAYFKGLEWWSKWIPVASSFAIIFILGANIAGIAPGFIDLSASFHHLEMLSLLLVSALLFSHFSSFACLLMAGYLFFIRIPFVNQLTPSAKLEDLYLILSLFIMVVLLGKNMPWSQSKSVSHHRKLYAIKEMGTIIVSFSAVCILGAALLKTSEFRYWLTELELIKLNQQAFGFLLLATMTGWVLSVFNLGRAFLIPVLSLPTLAALAFVTGTGYPAMMAVLAVFVAMFFASADQRHLLK